MENSQGKLNVETKNFIPSLLIIAYLLVGFIPNIDAVDKVAPQWVYLSIINILSTIHLFLNRNKFENILNQIINSGISLFYIAFFGARKKGTLINVGE